MQKNQSDWPCLRGNNQHTGFVASELRPPFKLTWVREIQDERLGTAMEPIVSGDKVLVATHAGNLYALRVDSGEALWKFQAHGPFLHSPAVHGNTIVPASTDGALYGLSAESGKLIWHCFVAHGGFSASPVVDGGLVFIGTRAGDFLAVSLSEGKVVWRQNIGRPIRQTAAVAGSRVFVTAEDLKVHCFSVADGKPLWTSESMPGQTARDYYPTIVNHNGRMLVIVRTNPILNMGQRISRDRTMLCRNAGIDDSSWQKLETWIKSEQARGNPELWAKEQKAILEHLAKEPDARTFFVLDAETGKEAFTAPVLWIGGCQGVGAQPALTASGQLLVFYRSAYGNWNQGVAPLVTLGLLDPNENKITPLFHRQGAQPLWNCFWGTADESQNFLIAGDTVLIIHQGTLSGFHLKNNNLFPIWGERDTYGGFQNPSWARNEWHGPARSGVALAGNHIFWQTGSRILCITAGEGSNADAPKPAKVLQNVPSSRAPPPRVRTRAELLAELKETTNSILSREWAPLFTDPGLAGRVFAFQNSGELFEALAWAYPHLDSELQAKTKSLLRAEWSQHLPVTAEGSYPLDRGARREWSKVPAEYCVRLGGDKRPHAFGNTYAVWLFAERCGEHALVLENWPKLKLSFEDFRKTGWRLDPQKGDPYANRYLASLMSLKSLADKAADGPTSQAAARDIEQTTEALVAWWTRAAERGTLTAFNKSSELDRFIGQGDDIWVAMAPHRHTLALFQNLTPEIATLVLRKILEAVKQVWQTFVTICPTWHLAGEERQVHFGENFLDPRSSRWAPSRHSPG